MIKWIIKKWTKKGETILDPMAGTFSTCVMAAMLERNAIGVEYEEKFYQMGLKNKELFERTYMMPKGKIAVLKGDARSLSDVLFANSELIDKIVFSPPYAEILGSGHRSKLGNIKKQGSAYQEFGEQPHKDNIGNMRYGNVDAIVTSPPYEDRGIGDWSTPRYEFVAWIKEQLKTKGYIEWKGKKYTEREWRDMNYGRIDGRVTKGVHKQPTTGYSKDPKNLGNLKTQTYLSAMLQVYAECLKVLKPNGLMILITKNFIRKKKVVRLDLDTIKLCRKAGFTFIDRWYRKLTHFSFWVINYRRKYPEVEQVNYEDILVFQKPDGEGKIDAVVFSPPYAEMAHKTLKNPVDRRDKDPTLCHEYSDDKSNIGNLPYGKIDAIITSPPYSKAVSAKSDPEARRRRLQKAGYKNYQGGEARCLQMDWTYSDDELNIGNLPYGSTEEL